MAAVAVVVGSIHFLPCSVVAAVAAGVVVAVVRVVLSVSPLASRTAVVVDVRASMVDPVADKRSPPPHHPVAMVEYHHDVPIDSDYHSTVHVHVHGRT